MPAKVFRFTATDPGQRPAVRYWNDQTHTWGPPETASRYEVEPDCWQPPTPDAGTVELVDDLPVDVAAVADE